MRVSKDFNGQQKIFLFFALGILPFFLNCIGILWHANQNPDKEDDIGIIIPSSRYQTPSGSNDPGPENFTSVTFYEEMSELCDPTPCVHPEDETDSVVKMDPSERQALEKFRDNIRKQLDEEDAPLAPDEEVKPVPLAETLAYHADFYDGDYVDITPYAFTRIMLNDVKNAPKANVVRRKYELKRLHKTTLQRIAELEIFKEINRDKKIMDPVWLETEMRAAIQIRRTIVRELWNRKVWENRNNLEDVIEPEEAE